RGHHFQCFVISFERLLHPSGDMREAASQLNLQCPPEFRRSVAVCQTQRTTRQSGSLQIVPLEGGARQFTDDCAKLIVFWKSACGWLHKRGPSTHAHIALVMQFTFLRTMQSKFF